MSVKENKPVESIIKHITNAMISYNESKGPTEVLIAAVLNTFIFVQHKLEHD